MDLQKLINKNRWETIFKQIKSGKIKGSEMVAAGNTVSHLAAVNNQSKIIEYIAKKNYQNLANLDGSGLTAVHLLAKYGYHNLLKSVLKIRPDLVNVLDFNHDTILHHLSIDEKSHPTFRWIIQNLPKIDLDICNNNGETILLRNILSNKTEGDSFHQNIVILLDNRVNGNKPTDNPPLITAIKQRKKYIVDPLLKMGIDVNKKDGRYITPFLHAINNEMYDVAEELLKKGADIDYAGPEGDNNPLIYAVSKNDGELVDLLLDNKFNPNKYDRNMEIPLHRAIKAEGKPDLIVKLILYSDLNAVSVFGETPLSLLVKHHDWENYRVILENKKIDIFQKDREGRRVIDYIDNERLDAFLDMVANSYRNQLGGDQKLCSELDSIKCTKLIKKQIMKSQQSYPEADDVELMTKKINMVKGDNRANFGLFNTDTLHNVIYFVLMIKRYENLGIPFQFYNPIKSTNDKIDATFNNLYRSERGLLMSNLIKAYTEYFYEFLPYYILWCNENEYYINKDIDVYVKKLLVSQKIRFIAFKISLIPSTSSTHANLLIFDKKKGILERFEPYGVVPYLDNPLMDQMIEQRLSVLKEYSGNKFIYLTPKKFMKNLSFQTISDDENIMNRKLGDPFGYCLAWCFWYLEMRINNPDLHPERLIEISTKKIIKRNEKMIDFIREYSSKINSKKNDFLLSAGVPEAEMYNMALTNKNKERVIRHLTSTFSSHILKKI